VYLCADGVRGGHDDLAEAVRRRGIATAIVVGAVALAGVVVLRADAPRLFHGLTHRALPLMLLSGVAGLGSVHLLVRRRYGVARVAAALAVAAVLWGWGVGQYPYLVEPSYTVRDAAAAATTLRPLLVTMAVAALLVGPSLVLLIAMFQRPDVPSSR
jgi:cytochrome d ubiquinol oxidase subunit II